MRLGLRSNAGGTRLGLGLLVAVLAVARTHGDEPSRLSRLFRFGLGTSPNPPAASAPPAALPPAENAAAQPAPAFAASPNPPSGPAPRILPQPRINRAATESDPIVSRITLARSSEGSSFGMFLQVYADGTIIDSEGVHHLNASDLRPLNEALQASEIYRPRSHCGAPPTDFVEEVHITVFERSLGRLRANAFSYSGNVQGCDPAVQRLHAALDGVQAKLSRSVPATASPVSTAPAGPAPVSTPTPPGPPLSAPSTGVVIPLTPLE